MFCAGMSRRDAHYAERRSRHRTFSFPEERGLFRSESSLKKAFAEVACSSGLKKIHAAGVRRTFNDQLRRAGRGPGHRSISGHLTDQNAGALLDP